MARNLRKSAVYTRNFPQQITRVEFNSFRSELYYRYTFPIQSMVGEKKDNFWKFSVVPIIEIIIVTIDEMTRKRLQKYPSYRCLLILNNGW